MDHSYKINNTLNKNKHILREKGIHTHTCAADRRTYFRYQTEQVSIRSYYLPSHICEKFISFMGEFYNKNIHF